LKTYILTTFAIFFLTSCTGEKIAGGKITIRNDILDKSYNTFIVDQIISNKGAAGFSKVFKPGEEFSLPVKNLLKMRFRRQYEDHTKVYLVSCPQDMDEAITLKLIDVHSNRMAGGCVLYKRGVTQGGGFTKWEK